MPTFYFCIHHFEAASPFFLHEFEAELEYGKLYAAVPVVVPSLVVADELRTKICCNTFTKLGFGLPDQIHEDEDYHTYFFSPFIKRQKTTTFSEYLDHRCCDYKG